MLLIKPNLRIARQSIIFKAECVEIVFAVRPIFIGESYWAARIIELGA